MNTETMQLYNQMFNALVVNIYSKSKNADGNIEEVIVNHFCEKSVWHQLFLNAANTTTTIFGGYIKVHMPWWKYIIWKWPRRHTHRNIKWQARINEQKGLSPVTEMVYVSDAFHQHMGIWDKIFNVCFTLPSDEEEGTNV